MPYMNFGDVGQEETFEAVLFDYSGEPLNDGLGAPPHHHHGGGGRGRGRGSYWGGYSGGYPYLTVSYGDLDSEKLDKIYERHKDEMTAAGFPPGTWTKLTAQQKLDAFAKVVGKSKKGVSDYYRPASEMIPGMLGQHSGSMRVSPWVQGPMPDPNELNAALGVGDLGISFKSAKKSLKKTVAKVTETVKKVAPYTSLPALIASKTKFGKNVVLKVRDIAKRYGPITLKIVGVAAAPFTGGASLALVSAVGMYEQVKVARQNANLAKAQARADAAALDAEAKRQETDLNAQLDGFYAQNQQMMATFGFTPDKWAAMTAKEKIEAIDKANQVASSVADLDKFYAGNQEAMALIGYGPDKWATMSVEEKSSAIDKAVAMTADQWNALTQTQAASGGVPSGGATPPSGDASLPTSEVPVEQTPPPPPPPTVAGGAFKLVVEGAEVGSYGSVEEAASAASSLTKPGDRFDVLADGKSTGLRIRTDDGVVPVPPDMVAQVSAMTPDQIKKSVANVAVKKPSGFPLWLLAVPAVALVASR